MMFDLGEKQSGRRKKVKKERKTLRAQIEPLRTSLHAGPAIGAKGGNMSKTQAFLLLIIVVLLGAIMAFTQYDMLQSF